jgi:hypothetical protein
MICVADDLQALVEPGIVTGDSGVTRDLARQFIEAMAQPALEPPAAGPDRPRGASRRLSRGGVSRPRLAASCHDLLVSWAEDLRLRWT